ncbi:hypothetical protein J3R82DRAFT_3878 [Butyriboletus roseoflavus]|nr:hypothetical protein J3R82DRAFT_3878 [Butyriboletus roseoflavus]
MELARFGTRGFMDGLLSGRFIGLPLVLNFGSPEIQSRYVLEILGERSTLYMPSQKRSRKVILLASRRLE